MRTATHCRSHRLHCRTQPRALPHTAARTTDAHCVTLPHGCTAAHCCAHIAIHYYQAYCCTLPCAHSTMHTATHGCSICCTSLPHCHTLPHCRTAAHCCVRCHTLPSALPHTIAHTARTLQCVLHTTGVRAARTAAQCCTAAHCRIAAHYCTAGQLHNPHNEFL
jgi:hypothetical protein